MIDAEPQRSSYEEKSDKIAWCGHHSTIRKLLAALTIVWLKAFSLLLLLVRRQFNAFSLLLLREWNETHPKNCSLLRIQQTSRKWLHPVLTINVI